VFELRERRRGALVLSEEQREGGPRKPVARNREPPEGRAGILREPLPDAFEHQLIQRCIRAPQERLRGTIVVQRSRIPHAHPRVAARRLTDRLHHRRRPSPRLQLFPRDRDQLLARQRVETDLHDLLVAKVALARDQ
jgi:hypothetical protein